MEVIEEPEEAQMDSSKSQCNQNRLHIPLKNTQKKRPIVTSTRILDDHKMIKAKNAIMIGKLARMGKNNIAKKLQIATLKIIIKIIIKRVKTVLPTTTTGKESIKLHQNILKLSSNLIQKMEHQRGRHRDSTKSRGINMKILSKSLDRTIQIGRNNIIQ